VASDDGIFLYPFMQNDLVVDILPPVTSRVKVIRGVIRVAYKDPTSKTTKIRTLFPMFPADVSMS
tara:strand:- start:179 stop:373 length:195 start_codon:yes stop_codon:yes gene_type:complete